MQPSRRSVLQAAGLLLCGCDGAYRELSKRLGADIPAAVGGPDAAAHHLLSRAAWGPWPGDVDRARAIGADAWIEEQLGPLDDPACEVLVRRFESLNAAPGDMFEFKRPVIREELVRATVLRAVYSRRQLVEVMVGFWTDHFNIHLGKGACAWLTAAHDRDVVRRHALGNFRNLVRDSATHPAMLVYLDGDGNRAGTPNENYARELLELHTLGVHGGYSQRDVMEAARCLTGWRVRRKWNKGTVEFEPSAHDAGEKTVLGRRADDLEQLLDILVLHPSTAGHLATKLCRRFVRDDPPAALVDRVARTYLDSRGEIRPTVAAVLRSDEFRASRGAKLKRPFRFVVSALRALGADTDGRLDGPLARMGQAPFDYPTPDGYPDEATPWLGTLLWRWNFAVDLAERAPFRIPVDDRLAYLFGRPPTDDERAAIGDDVALALASPAFQVH